MSNEFAQAIGALVAIADDAIPEDLDAWLDVLDSIVDILRAYAKDIRDA